MTPGDCHRIFLGVASGSMSDGLDFDSDFLGCGEEADKCGVRAILRFSSGIQRLKGVYTVYVPPYH